MMIKNKRRSFLIMFLLLAGYAQGSEFNFELKDKVQNTLGHLKVSRNSKSHIAIFVEAQGSALKCQVNLNLNFKKNAGIFSQTTSQLIDFEVELFNEDQLIKIPVDSSMDAEKFELNSVKIVSTDCAMNRVPPSVDITKLCKMLSGNTPQGSQELLYSALQFTKDEKKSFQLFRERHGVPDCDDLAVLKENSLPLEYLNLNYQKIDRWLLVFLPYFDDIKVIQAKNSDLTYLAGDFSRFNPNLEVLDLERSPIQKISNHWVSFNPQQTLRLKDLNLSYTPIKEFELNSDGRYFFSKLNLGHTQIKNLDFLNEKLQVQRLDISSTEVTSLKGIESQSLSFLKMANTKVSGLKELGQSLFSSSDKIKLKLLDISGTDVKDLSDLYSSGKLNGLEALQSLNIAHSQFDVSSLADSLNSLTQLEELIIDEDMNSRLEELNLSEKIKVQAGSISIDKNKKRTHKIK